MLIKEISISNSMGKVKYRGPGIVVQQIKPLLVHSRVQVQVLVPLLPTQVPNNAPTKAVDDG